MKTKRAPVAQVQTQYWAYRHSGTGVTVTDNSERPIPVISSDNYSVLQPIFSEKGITDEWVAIEGSDTVSTYLKLFGKPNTVKYGKPATYAYAALLGGFRLYTLNVAPPEATYANFYIGMQISKAKKRKQAMLPTYGPDGKMIMEEADPSGKPGVLTPKESLQDTSEKTTEDLEKTLYVKIIANDAAHDGKKCYYMKWSKEELPEGLNNEEVYEIPLKHLEIEFSNFFVEDCNNQTNLYTYLSGDVIQAGDKTAFKEVHAEEDDTTLDKEFYHVPLVGLAYRGRGSYGNIFRAEFARMSDKLEGKYPYYNCAVYDKQDLECTFNFAMFDISRGSFSYSFRDQAAANCRIVQGPGSIIETFRGYSIKRDQSNGITNAVTKAMKQLEKYMKTEIQKKVSSFETDLLGSDVVFDDWKRFQAGFQGVIALFTRPNTDEGRSKESPISNIDIFDPMYAQAYQYLPIKFTVCPKSIMFSGGKLGPLKQVLQDRDFSWDIELEKETWVLGENGLPKWSGGKPGSGHIITKKETYKVFLELFKAAYSGETDASLFDESIIHDAILFADGYPLELQEVVDSLCNNWSETKVSHQTGRLDFCYIRTPDANRRTIRQCLEWQKSFLNQAKNMNMHPVCGKWSFADITTGGQQVFEAFYDYLGVDSSLYAYLTSQTTDSFASGEWSKIRKGIPNSQELIPTTHQEREELALADVMYYVRKSDGSYGLGEDLGYNIGKSSVMKSIGSNIQFNRILNIASLILRDNPIINPTKDNLDNLKRRIEEAIKVPAKHFRDRVQITMAISDHPSEVGRQIVRCEIKVVGHDYSRANRLHMISERAGKNE